MSPLVRYVLVVKETFLKNKLYRFSTPIFWGWRSVIRSHSYVKIFLFFSTGNFSFKFSFLYRVSVNGNQRLFRQPILRLIDSLAALEAFKPKWKQHRRNLYTDLASRLIRRRLSRAASSTCV